MNYIKTYESFKTLDFSDRDVESLEESIDFALRWYSSLYGKRWGRIKVLKTMYIDFGTGYRWENGRLLSVYDRNNKNMYAARSARHDYELPNKRKELEGLLDQWDAITTFTPESGILGRLKQRIDDLQDEIDVFDPFYSEFPDEDIKPTMDIFRCYSVDHSPIFNIPDNVEDDYLNGAKEIISYILSLTTEKYTQIYKEFEKLANKLGMF